VRPPKSTATPAVLPRLAAGAMAGLLSVGALVGGVAAAVHAATCGPSPLPATASSLR
jgi:hypothetical protein